MIVNKNKLFCVIFIVVFINVTGVSASAIIFKNSFDEIYNVGDNLFVNFSIDMDGVEKGFIEVEYVCDGRSMIIFRKYQEVRENKNNDINFDFPLLYSGECKLVARFKEELNYESEVFSVSNNIKIDYTINNREFYPEEKLKINGSFTKENKDVFDGLVYITCGDLFNKTIDIDDGELFFETIIGTNSQVKKYELKIEAVETDSDNLVLNRGIRKLDIEIKPKPTSIEIISEDNFKPPYNLSITAKLLDQSGGLIVNESLGVKVLDSNKNEVFYENVKSGENVIYEFKSGSSQSSWEIVSFYGGISGSKLIFEDAAKKVKVEYFEDDGSYLKITNVGNIVYNGNVEVILKGDTENKTIPVNVSNLKPGDSYRYDFEVEGNYSIEAEGINFGFRDITGDAISLPEIKSSRKRAYIISFICVLVFVVSFLYFYFIKGRKSGKTSGGDVKKNKGVVGINDIMKGQRKSYIIIISLEKYDEAFERISKKYGFEPKKIKDNKYFVMFYSNVSKRPELKLFNYAKEIIRTLKSNDKDNKVKIFVNSEIFHNSASFLKDFSLLSKKINNSIRGELVVSKTIFENLGISAKDKEKIVIDSNELFVYKY